MFGGTRPVRRALARMVNGMAAAWLVIGCTASAPRGLNAAPGEAGPAGATAAPSEVKAAAAGDPDRGRELAFSRDANCVLCHMMPERGGADASMRGGTLAPPLAGVARRYGAQQLRERINNPARDNPDTIMPAYSRTEGLVRVAKGYVGQPILQPQQIEDIVAWLLTLN